MSHSAQVESLNMVLDSSLSTEQNEWGTSITKGGEVVRSFSITRHASKQKSCGAGKASVLTEPHAQTLEPKITFKHLGEHLMKKDANKLKCILIFCFAIIPFFYIL